MPKFLLEQADVVVIGGGAAGIGAVRALSQRGYKVALIEKKTIGSGTTGQTPGRFTLGLHYKDPATAITCLIETLSIFNEFPDYLVGKNLPLKHPVRRGRYYITKNSDYPPELIIATYLKVQQKYAELYAENPKKYEAFGHPDEFIRFLKPEEYADQVNADIVAVGIESAEHLFDVNSFLADIKKEFALDDNILVLEHTEVINGRHGDLNKQPFVELQQTILNRKMGYSAADVNNLSIKDDSCNDLTKKRFALNLQQTIISPETGDSTVKNIAVNTDYVINSTWHHIQALNNEFGIRMIPGSRTNRLKALIVVKLPEELLNINSAFFCMGPFCMYSNMGNGLGMLTSAEATNLETSSDEKISPRMQRFVSGQATEEEKNDIAMEILHGYSIGWAPEKQEERARLLQKNKLFVKIVDGYLKYSVVNFNYKKGDPISPLIILDKIALNTLNCNFNEEVTLSELMNCLPQILSKTLAKGHTKSQGVVHYIPKMATAQIVDVHFGIVQTEGVLTLADLKDPTSNFHNRDYFGVQEEQMGLISNPGIKLFRFLQNGKRVADRYEAQRTIQVLIDRCYGKIYNLAAEERVGLSPMVATILARMDVAKSLAITLDRSVLSSYIEIDSVTKRPLVRKFSEEQLSNWLEFLNGAEFFKTIDRKFALNLEITQPSNQGHSFPNEMCSNSSQCETDQFMTDEEYSANSSVKSDDYVDLELVLERQFSHSNHSNHSIDSNDSNDSHKKIKNRLNRRSSTKHVELNHNNLQKHALLKDIPPKKSYIASFGRLITSGFFSFQSSGAKVLSNQTNDVNRGKSDYTRNGKK